VVSEETVAGLAMSEAEVIREVFRMAAVEHKSCRVLEQLWSRIVLIAPLHSPRTCHPYYDF
jgi:hypothetical protein